MGNTKAPATTRKTKKKGRPSLLDIQSRSLLLQQEQHCDPSPDGDNRRAAGDRQDSDQGRREKKLGPVLHLSDNPNADSAAARPESDDGRTRKVGLVRNDPQAQRQNPTLKVTDLPQDYGPTTSLPDKKLLVFILDRLQKKDSYGVFAEPVDPEELPDYHDIIKHPMDFATIRKKVSDGVYGNLEQFENDVFLICSNAMQYNASDTIYHRQARAIQELAKKNFYNLRQERDDNEQEQKPARRGRPPTKDIFKKIGRPPSVDARETRYSVNFSPDLSQKVSDKTTLTNLPTKTCGIRNTEAHNSNRNEDTSGSAIKGGTSKYSKKSVVIDENRRNAYTEPQQLSVLTTFDGERKQLIPVGLYTENAYARSLARFAAKFGPVGWEIAARRIEHVLPRGTKFGRGWVGEKDASSQMSQPPLISISPHSFQPENTPSTSASVSENAVDDTENEVKARSTPSATPSSLPCRYQDSAEYSTRDRESSSKPHSAVGFHGIWQKVANQLPKVGAMQPTLNGFNTPSGFNHLSHSGRTFNASSPPGNFSFEAMVMHSRAPTNMLPINSIQPSTSNRVNSTADPNTASSFLPDDSHGCQRTREAVTMPRPVSFPPNLNVGFHPTGSPVSGVLLDSQNPNPNLALGL
ncbi:transcription factor GTE4-like [Zingiber officinale]|uniref:transcription factor GTE4-like n=1 Tax=Zingiber officinale TaxID=94328 RepID=UPI001C4B1177|nr:transcription factor GTE4-like [Zingiber officinale]XP_042431441.1 transcription factor GTE4-like [Zingiber officinale]